MVCQSVRFIAVIASAVALSIGASKFAQATDIYSNDFEGAVGGEWSDTTTSTTPIGARQFLGEFHNSTVSLWLDSLPAHTSIAIEFDLYVIRSWDGNELLSVGVLQGPDVWELAADTETLIRTTFSNIDDFDDATFPQAYPGDVAFDVSERTETSGSRPGDTAMQKGPIGGEGDHFPGTGALEINTLGYIAAEPMDAVYRIVAVFPHTSATVQFDFAAELVGGGIGGESWGIDNVSVQLFPVTLSAVGDSFLRSPKNANEGANLGLRVDKNRTVVKFDQAAIDDAISGYPALTTATLVLSIDGLAHKWRPGGGNVNAYPLDEDFAEGNGEQLGTPRAFRTRGFGPGVTWNCSIDEDISNRQRDCDEPWGGGNFNTATADPVLHTNGLAGEVMWDVTDDVFSARATGWLIKKTNERRKGEVIYFSKEGAFEAGSPDLAPRLVLE